MQMHFKGSVLPRGNGAVVEVAQEGRVGRRGLHTQERGPARGPGGLPHGAQVVKLRTDVASKNAGETGLSEQLC